MWTRLLFFLILGFLAVVIQMGLIAALPQSLSLVNVTLSVLILLFFLNPNRGFLFFSIIWIGYLTELFSPSLFGFHLLALLVTFSLIIVISQLFLTNKTLLVLLVTSFLFFIFYNLIFVFLNFLVSLKYDFVFSYSFLDYLKIGLLEALINIPLILILNLLIKKSAGLFKKIFILN